MQIATINSPVRLLSSSAVLGLSFFLSNAAAQTNAPEAGQRAIEEITVTASRRTTGLQDTPMAISAFSMDRLSKLDIRNANDLAQSVPGLEIGQTVGNLQIGLRGVSNDSFFLAGDPTVAFHVDGIYRGRQTGGNAIFMDVERVEVLKGPQGTLYGRNATAGSINVITAKPTFEFAGYNELVVGDFDRAGLAGMLNVPASDRLAFRLAYLAQVRDGYYENGPDIEDYGDADEGGVRLHGLFNISDRSSLLLTLDWQGRFGVGDGSVLLPEPDGDLEDFIDGNPYQLILNTEGDRDDDFYTLRAEFNHDFDFGQFTYLGAYLDTSVFLLIDFDRQDRSPLQQTLAVQVDSQQHSHEFQLTSGSEGRLEWLVAGYLFYEDAQRHLEIFFAPNFENMNDQPNFTSDSQAVFGDVTYGLTDNVNISGGLRWSRVEKSDLNTLQTQIRPNGIFTAMGNEQETWNSLDWTVGLDWHANEDNMLYGKVGTGFKSGGFNDPLLGLDDAEFDQEEILAVQFGHKSMFLDGRLQVNSEAFWYDYTDLQVNQIVDNLNLVRNAAEARIQGFDTEIVLVPTDRLRIDFALAYLDTEYRDFVQFDPIRGIDVNLEGASLRQAPEWSMNVIAEYTFMLPGDWELTPGFSSAYQTETKHRVFSDPGATQPDFHRSNAHLTLLSPEGRWQARAFVTNLEDEFVATNIGLNGRNERTIRGEPPRMWGVRLRYNFGAGE